MGFEQYPLSLIVFVDNFYEQSGILLNQDQALAFDPIYLGEIAKYRRWKRAVRKEKKRPDQPPEVE